MVKHVVTSLSIALLALSGVSCRNTQQPPAQPAVQNQPAPEASQAPPSAGSPAEQALAPAPATGPGTAASGPAGGASVTPPRAPAATAARPAPTAQPTRTEETPPTAPAPPAAPVVPEPPKPEYEEFTIPAGTTLSVVLETTVASDTSKVDEPVRGRIGRPVLVKGQEVIGNGARVTGSVTEAKPSAKVKGLAQVAFQFTRVSAGEETYGIETAPVVRQAKSTKAKDAKKIGIGAGAGAIIGGIAGGGKGAAIGAGIGGGAGTGVVMATKGEEVRVAAGTTVSVKLQEPLTVRVLVKP